MVSYKNKQLRAIKRALYSFIALMFVAYGLASSGVLSGTIVGAAPQPESCFTFYAPTREIRGYDHITCGLDVSIPETIGGLPVLRIAGIQYSGGSYTGPFYNKGIESVILPSSLTYIGNDAFSFNDIETVTIPGSVTYMTGAFGNNLITEVTLGDGIEVVSGGAFANNLIHTVNYSSTLREIGYSAFWNNRLTEMSLPSSVVKIDSAAFGANRLTSVSIPDSVKDIGSSVIKDNQVTELSVGTPGYSGPADINIDLGAFADMGLETVSIGASVNTINAGAFARNPIKNLTISEGVETIHSGAFNIGADIDTLFIPNSVTSIRNGAFTGDDCEAYHYYIYPSITYDPASCAPNENGGSKIKNLTIGTSDYSGDPVLDLSPGSFSGLNLESLTLGNNIRSIQRGAFARNNLYSVDLGDSVQSINDGAFSQAGAIDEVVIPASVTSIYNAFTGDDEGNPHPGRARTQLRSLIFASRTTEQSKLYIGYGAFTGLNIENLILNNAVNEISYGAFARNNISNLDLGSGVTAIRSGAFSLALNLENLTIPDSVEVIEEGAFTGDNTFTQQRIESCSDGINGGTGPYICNSYYDNVVRSEAMYNSNKIKNLYVGTELYSGDPKTEIRTAAFKAAGIENLVLGRSVSFVGNSAFANNNISNLSLGDGVSTISQAAFYGNNLTTVSIPDQVSLLEPAFGENPLVNVAVGSSTYLGEPSIVLSPGAFSDLSISNLTINRAVSSVGRGAFSNNNLSQVNINGNPIMGDGVFAYNGVNKSTVPSGSDLVKSNYYHDNSNIVKIYTSDSAFPASGDYQYSPLFNGSGQAISTYSGDGHMSYSGASTPVVSAYVVNPAQYTVSYVDEDGNQLAPTKTVSATIGGDVFSGYKLTDTLSSDGSSVAVNSYHRLGQTVQAKVLDIEGYETPEVQSGVLESISFPKHFTYTYKVSDSDTDPGEEPGVPGGEQPGEGTDPETPTNPDPPVDPPVNPPVTPPTRPVTPTRPPVEPVYPTNPEINDEPVDEGTETVTEDPGDDSDNETPLVTAPDNPKPRYQIGKDIPDVLGLGTVMTAITNFIGASDGSPATVITVVVASTTPSFIFLVLLVREAYKELSYARSLRKSVSSRKKIVKAQEEFTSYLTGQLESMSAETKSLADRNPGDVRYASVSKNIVDSLLSLSGSSFVTGSAAAVELEKRLSKNVLISFFFWLPIVLSVILTLASSWLMNAAAQGVAPPTATVIFFIVLIAVVLSAIFVSRTLYLNKDRDRVRDLLLVYEREVFADRINSMTSIKQVLDTQIQMLRTIEATSPNQENVNTISRLSVLSSQLGIILSTSRIGLELEFGAMKSTVANIISDYAPTAQNKSIGISQSLSNLYTDRPKIFEQVAGVYMGRALSQAKHGSELRVDLSKSGRYAELTIDVDVQDADSASALSSPVVYDIIMKQLGGSLHSGVGSNGRIVYRLLVPVVSKFEYSRLHELLGGMTVYKVKTKA